MERFEGEHVARLEISLLGPFVAVLDGDPITGFESDSARALLAYLASEPGRPSHRAVLAEMLWPERPEGAALSNLRHVLSVLRRALGDRERDSQHLETDRSNVALVAGPEVWVDLAEFERLADTPVDEEGAVEAWESAVQLWRGSLLEDIHVRAGVEWDEWVIVTAERARRHLAGALRSLVTHHERAGDWSRAIPVAERLAEVDPWDERAHRQLMRLLAGSGDPARALAHFAALSDRLEAELGAVPAVGTAALAGQIRAGNVSEADPDLEIAYPQFLTVARPAMASPLFVGRERELDFLHRRLDAAFGGGGRVVMVAGEAGSGKTMLAAEFAQQATDAPGLLVAMGRCNAYGGLGDPYLPFREVLGALTGDVEASLGAGALDREQATRLWEAIPLTSRLTYERGPSLLGVMVNGMMLARRAEQAMPGADWLEGLRNRAEVVASRPPVPERMQPALFDEYTALLHGVAAAHPLLIVVDDLQWADRASIALLWHLARRLGGQRILIVGLYRPEEIVDSAGGTHPLEPVIRELQAIRSDCAIELGSDRGFVDALVDSEPNELDGAFRDRLYSYTEGHPLFTVEMVRGMQDRADIRRNQAGIWTAQESLDWEALPTRVEAVVAQRIARLPGDLQRDLMVAAVQGEEFAEETVAAVREDPDASARLGLESTSQHRLIEPLGATRADGKLIVRHRFRHILFQRYLYGLLDDAERVRLHEKTGKAIEALFQGHSEPPVVDLAHHFDEAGLVEPAIAYLQLAGQRAYRMSGNDEAIRHLSRAVELIPTLPEGPERDVLELGLLVALAAPTMAVRGYTAPELERSGWRVRELCNRLDPSPMTAMAIAGISHFATLRALHGLALATAEEVQEIARDLGDPGLIMLSHYMMGYEQTWQGDLDAGHDNIAVARGRYDPDRHGWLMYVLGQAVGPEALVWDAFNMAHRGYPDQAIELAEEGIALARRIGHPFSLNHALGIGGVLVRLALHDFETALDRNEEFAEVAAAEHFEFWSIAADIYRAAAKGYVEDGEAGIVELQRGLDAWETMGVGAFRGYWYALMAGLEQCRGRPARGLEIIERELGPAAESLEWLCHTHLLVPRARLMREMGDPDAAVRAAEEAVEASRGIGARLLELRAATELATVHSEADRTADAEKALEPIYSWFTEGFDAPDLVAARAVLDRL
ncbi:MAG: AAA family ATPase [Actinomycetota bacterium]